MSELEGVVHKEMLSTLTKKINELQEQNTKLANANAELKALDKIKDEFINIASHELRGPIQPILGYITMVKSGDVDLNVALDVIYGEALKLKQAAHNILDANKLDNQSISYNFEKTKIHEILIKSMTAAAGMVDRNKVVLIPKIDDKHRNIEILVDKSRIEQVFTNVLGNAVKFTKQGTITAKTKIYKDANIIEILIIDTGPGIPKEILPKLFEKFATLSVHNNNNGMGLGLFICKAIVVAHGGEIEARNNKNAGATIRITLPFEPNQKSSKSIGLQPE